jgi:hypothetical protein
VSWGLLLHGFGYGHRHRFGFRFGGFIGGSLRQPEGQQHQGSDQEQQQQERQRWPEQCS